MSLRPSFGRICSGLEAFFSFLLVGLMMLAPSACGSQSRQEISILTGGTGGVYYPLGGALAELIGRHLEGYGAVAEVTGASVENLGLLYRGEADLAFTLADTLRQAYQGAGPFEGRPLSSLRTLVALYPNAVHLVTLHDSGIARLGDLKGRRVSVGAPGSGTEVSARALLEANGIRYSDFSPQRLNFNETTAALRDRQIDAGFWSVAPPTSAILDLAHTHRIAFVSLTPEEIEAVRRKDPVYSPFLLAAGTYPGQAEDIATINTPNLLVVDRRCSEELAYALVELLLHNRDYLSAVHPAIRSAGIEFTLESTPIPLHSGAVRYFREAGFEVPESLVGD